MISTTFRPRFKDLDAMGHVNHAVFITYLEICRTDWFSSLKDEIDLSKTNFIIARVEMDYHSAIHRNAEVQVNMWVSKIGNKSWTFDYLVEDKKSGEKYATAKTVQVVYNYEKETTEDIPDMLREVLSKHHSEN